MPTEGDDGSVTPTEGTEAPVTPTEEAVPGLPEEQNEEMERAVVDSGTALLNQWNNLKEVFKIPKKEKKPEPSNRGKLMFLFSEFV